MSRLLVGLTGGIASGKSTVGRWLRELGCTVADADSLVADLYLPGAEGSLDVARLFGPEVLAADGSVDRQELSRRVFADPEQRRLLEAAIHPLVAQTFADLLQNTDGILVYEVPLMVETGGGGRFDYVVAVAADQETRLQRAVERGLDEPAARSRLAAQATDEQRAAIADRVLDNNGSEADLRAQVEELYAELVERSATID